MKKTRDLIKELNVKKFDRPSRLKAFGYHLLASTYWVTKKYKPQYKIIDKIPDKGPAFYIWNHTNRRDEHFCTEMAYPARVNILCEWNEFFRSHTHFMLRHYPIIPKKVYANDFPSIRGMHRIIRQGGIVMFSPEGTPSIYGGNQPVVPGTGAFIKHYKIPVYCGKIEGGYLTNPKFDCFNDRLGKVFCTQYKLFSPEDLEKLTPEEIEDKINEAFDQEDYSWNKKMRIPYKKEHKGSLTDKMEYAFYLCPKCGHEYEMAHTEDNKIYCKHCGNTAIVNEYGDLIPETEKDVFPETPYVWGNNQRRKIIEDIRKDPNYEIKIHCWIGDIPRHHYLKKGETSERCGEGFVTINHDGFSFEGVRRGEPYKMHLSYVEIYSLVILLDFTFFLVFFNDDMLEFHPDEPIAMKMLLAVEEMHRFHVNTWKNLKKNAFLYEGLEEITKAKK